MLSLERLAAGAFHGVSMDPEGRARRAVEGYESECSQYVAKMREQAAKGGTQDLVEEEIARFVAGYRRHAAAYLASSSRCVSSFIAGPSNFPAARMNKRADIAHKRSNELAEFCDRALKAAVSRLRPDLRPIMAGDADAVERLEVELAALLARQAHMKAVNAAHARFLKSPASLDAAELSEAAKAAIRAYKPAYSWEPHPFPPYALSNHSANVRRVEKRLAAVKAAKAAPVAEVSSVSGNGIRCEDDPPANRVRLFFPGKPAEAVRSTLKSSGFRWAPSLGCWQAYRNYRAMQVARGFVSAEGAA